MLHKLQRRKSSPKHQQRLKNSQWMWFQVSWGNRCDDGDTRHKAEIREISLLGLRKYLPHGGWIFQYLPRFDGTRIHYLCHFDGAMEHGYIVPLLLSLVSMQWIDIRSIFARCWTHFCKTYVSLMTHHQFCKPIRHAASVTVPHLTLCITFM